MQMIINIPEHIAIYLKEDYEGDNFVYKILKNGVSLEEWLSTFNTNSATECFTAVQELKKRLEGEK